MKISAKILPVFMLLSPLSILAMSSHNLSCRCQPKQACWPTEKEWNGLAKQLTGKLVQPKNFFQACEDNSDGAACKKLLKDSYNPFNLQSKPSGSEVQGFWKGWHYHNSTYAVEAKNTADVVAAVNFAREHNLRLVIKGAGHDYIGRSNSPNSLLIWTRPMQQLHFSKSFVPQGAPKTTKGVDALTVGAGVVWLRAYQYAQAHNQHISGGGCTSVGVVGGFVLGGGFGFYPRKFGVAASNLIQAKIVTANGKVLIANAYQNKDIFWAIRGGGPGFGVMTQLTYHTFPIPKYFGGVFGKVTAKNDKAYKSLIRSFIKFSPRIMNEHWGGVAALDAQNNLNINFPSVGIDKQTEKKVWAPFVKWVKQHHNIYKFDGFKYTQVAGNKFYTPSRDNPKSSIFPVLWGSDTPKTNWQWWWELTKTDANRYIMNFESWWLPANLFTQKDPSVLVNALFKSSRYAKHNDVMMQFIKGMAGGLPASIRRSRQTPVNPAAYSAAALAVVSADVPFDYYSVNSPKLKKMAASINQNAKNMHRSIEILKAIAPNSGSFVSETSYFEPNWQHSFWPTSYTRLYKIKQKYDPNGLFYCHHCVGSEAWQKGGMCRKPTS
jgi:hypothetical protein